MKRYNVFNQIHKGLRALLYDTALHLQHTDFTSFDEAERAFDKMESVLKAFHLHAEHEEGYLLAAVGKVNPILVNELECEHEKGAFLSHRMRSLVLVYLHATSTSARCEAGDAICKSFNEFIAFSLYHMNKEEEKLNDSLWLNYKDEEIIAIQKVLVESLPSEDLEFAHTWMLKGNSNTEIILWLRAVKNNAPDFVFKGLMNLAESVLSEERWTKVQEGLTEGAMVA
jgi:hypothetical protein